MPFREVHDMHIREISVGVSYPAYPATALKSGDAPRDRCRTQRHSYANYGIDSLSCNLGPKSHLKRANCIARCCGDGLRLA
jgi:hypothetical protein